MMVVIRFGFQQSCLGEGILEVANSVFSRLSSCKKHRDPRVMPPFQTSSIVKKIVQLHTSICSTLIYPVL